MFLLRCFAFLSVLISAALFSLSVNASELITFSCSWDNNNPIDVFVTPANGEATRSDGGRNYEIIKITKWAVWLEVYEPNNQAGLKIQMIERAESTNGKGGKWIDIVHSISGNVSPIVGGICWEK